MNLPEEIRRIINPTNRHFDWVEQEVEAILTAVEASLPEELPEPNDDWQVLQEAQAYNAPIRKMKAKLRGKS